MNALSKKALDMLEYNGYSLKLSEEEIYIRKSRGDSGCLIGFIFVGAFICFFALMTSVESGIIVFVISILIAVLIWRSSRQNSSTIFNLSRKYFKVDNGEIFIDWKPLSIIDGIFSHSKFVDEYSSAFKSTSEEHQVTIGLNLENNQLIPIFRLISDHAKPSKEMNEVHDFLETVIKHRVK